MTTGGPSWKPLPVIFDSIFSLFGGAAPDVWLIISRAGSLMSLVFAYRLAARAAGPLAGCLAIAWVLFAGRAHFVFGWLTFFSTGWSEGLLVALALGAVDAHFANRHRLALGAWFAAALIRPEAGAFLLVYAVMLARRDPAQRALSACVVTAIPLLWLGPELAASGHLFRGSERAQSDVPVVIAHARHPGLRDLAFLRDLLSLPVIAGVACCLVLVRQHRPARPLVITLGSVAIAWLAIVGLMAEVGYPGIPRFLVVSVAGLCTLAGIGWNWAIQAIPGPRRRRAAVVLVLALNTAFLAGHLRVMQHNLKQASYESQLNTQLSAAVVRAGRPPAIRHCGAISTNPLEVPALKWRLGYSSAVTYTQVRFGTIFSSRVFAQRRALPVAPPRTAGFHLIARTGTWTIYRRCRRDRLTVK